MNLFDKYQQIMETTREEKYRKTTDKTDKRSGRYAVLIYSEILRCHLWVVQDEKDRASLNTSEAVYTTEEIRMLKGSSREMLRVVQNAKQVISESKVVSTTGSPRGKVL